MMQEQGIAKTIARYIALTALFLVPLTPLIVSNSFFFPFITGKAFFFRIIIEIAVATWAVLVFMDKRYRPRFSWVFIAVLAFVAWMGLADLFALNVAKAFWSNFERMEGWVLLIHLLGFFVAASAVLRVEKAWRKWFLVSLGVATIVSFHAFLQIAGVQPIHQGSTRIDSSFGNSAYFAIYLLFNTFIALWLAFTEKTRVWLKYSLIVFAVIEAFLIFMTETRGTILGLVGALLFAAFLFALTAGKRVRRAAAAAFILILIVASGVYAARNTAFVQNNHVLQRITSISLSDGQVRFTIWHMAWEGFIKSPKTVLVGWGQEGFNYVFNKYYDPSLYAQEPWFDRAHNAFIDWLSAGGLPAFLLYLSLFVSAIVLLWQKDSILTRSERILLTAALLGYACHNLFVFDNLYSYIYFFAILAFIDSQVGRPIALFERARELPEVSAATYALPIAAIVTIGLIWSVNVPGMRDASELITAITPSASGSYATNITTFEDLVKHPSFAAQEIREQLVSLAIQVTQSQTATNQQKQEIATLAVNEMRKQVASYPRDAREQLQLAYAYSAENDNTGALAALKAATTLSPGKESIWIQTGITELNAGNSKAAKTDFDTAYALGPQFTDIAAYAAAGDIVTGNHVLARQILQNAYGTTTVDNNILAVAYYQIGDWTDLINLWKLRTAKPTASVQDWFGLAAAYYTAGNHVAAITTINQAVKLYPEYASDGQSLINQIEGKVATSTGP